MIKPNWDWVYQDYYFIASTLNQLEEFPFQKQLMVIVMGTRPTLVIVKKEPTKQINETHKEWKRNERMKMKGVEQPRKKRKRKKEKKKKKPLTKSMKKYLIRCTSEMADSCVNSSLSRDTYSTQHLIQIKTSSL